MAINLEGLPIVPGARTLTSGGPPIALNNEIRGGVHRISGQTGDTRLDIDGRYLQAGMLVYDELAGIHYQYIHVGNPPANPHIPNDPYRSTAGALPNAADNWVEFQSGSGGGSGQQGYSIEQIGTIAADQTCLLYTSPSPRDS